jgi:DinB superfamily
MHAIDLEPGRPAADECLPYYFEYIRLVSGGHIVKLLERQVAESAAYLAAFPPEQALRREAPGEWNAVEIVGHVADVERVFAYRALRIARADPVMWTKVEFADYAAAANFQEHPLGAVVAEFAAVRAASLALLQGLDAAAWERRAPADWTLRSVRAIAYTMAGHELHHLADIRRQHGGANRPSRPGAG